MGSLTRLRTRLGVREGLAKSKSRGCRFREGVLEVYMPSGHCIAGADLPMSPLKTVTQSRYQRTCLTVGIGVVQPVRALMRHQPTPYWQARTTKQMATQEVATEDSLFHLLNSVAEANVASVLDLIFLFGGAPFGCTVAIFLREGAASNFFVALHR